jgi:hypothetical protein
MAKLHEEVVVIKVSKLLKDSDTSSITILNQEIIDSLEAVVQELSGAGTLVEIQAE